MNMDKVLTTIVSAKFWMWFDIIFALLNTVCVCITENDWFRILYAFCLIALVACATIQFHRVKSAASNGK